MKSEDYGAQNNELETMRARFQHLFRNCFLCMLILTDLIRFFDLIRPHLII